MRLLKISVYLLILTLQTIVNEGIEVYGLALDSVISKSGKGLIVVFSTQKSVR